jgi:cytochrome b561
MSPTAAAMTFMQKYGAQLRILHWLMFVGFTALFVVGFFMTEFKEAEPWHLYNLHKSVGVLVLLLAMLRLFTRATGNVPTAEAFMTTKDEKVAKITQYLLYALMFIAPVSGYIMSNIHGHAVKFFGLSLPTLFAKNPVLEDFSHEAHEITAYVFLAVIVLHIFGVIVHHAKGHEILRRIT